MKPNYKKISKFLSLVLRHKPEVIGLELDENGWAKTEELLQKMTENQRPIDLETLEQVVANNNKKRFAFNEDGSQIRASQGHSVAVDLGYQPSKPPSVLYHGTAIRFLDSIEEKGLIKGNRNNVHLSKDLDTAINVGNRHGKVIVLEVAAEKMEKDGYDFFISANGVWLTKEVPVAYLIFPTE